MYVASSNGYLGCCAAVSSVGDVGTKAGRAKCNACAIVVIEHINSRRHQMRHGIAKYHYHQPRLRRLRRLGRTMIGWKGRWRRETWTRDSDAEGSIIWRTVLRGVTQRLCSLSGECCLCALEMRRVFSLSVRFVTRNEWMNKLMNEWWNDEILERMN